MISKTQDVTGKKVASLSFVWFPLLDTNKIATRSSAKLNQELPKRNEENFTENQNAMKKILQIFNKQHQMSHRVPRNNAIN